MKTLKSEIDASTNFVIPASDGGYFEARFVQREPHYFIVYLSSHSGCNQTCRFCHLTATGQTTMLAATMQDYVSQANTVLSHYLNLPEEMQTATLVHFNFMARGEPLLNPTVVDNATELFSRLSDTAASLGLRSKFKISSIIPTGFIGELSSIFADPRSMLYYSAYSTSSEFRKKWLPRAKPLEEALSEINAMQMVTGNPIALHWSYIDGQNDSEEEAFRITELINTYNIKCKFNVVRYNPYDSRYGFETPEPQIIKLFKTITDNIPHTTLKHKIVPRVGQDVKASCGMFIE